MNLTHDLVTDEIKNEIRESVKTKSRNPGFVLIKYENDPPVLLRYNDLKTLKAVEVITDQKPVKRTLRFCGYEIHKDQVEDYLHWFSGVIFGMLGDYK